MTQTPQQKDERLAGAGPRADKNISRGSLPPFAKLAFFRFFDRTVTITASLPRAIFCVLFFLFILVWGFIFGIMLGRGHNPEELVPELTKVMPTPGTAVTPPVATPEILPRKELQYHESLKGKNAGEKPRATPIAPPSPPVKEQAPKPEEKAAQQTTPAKPATQPTKQTPQEKTPPEVQDQDQTVYDYLYQVAASNNAANAQALQEKLNAAGFSTRVIKSVSNNVTWHRIVVSFKGRPEDTRMLRDKLTEFGIKSIILRGKTPAK